MTSRRSALLVGFLLVGLSNTGTSFAGEDYEVAAYYFPGYHADPRNDARLGKGWTEWQLIKAAKPRFPGHVQPKVPLWGYQDESDPRAFEQKIDAAADHGITAFIVDWYWYENAPFLQRALDEGFLKAKNRSRLKFALMWANHHWIHLFPYKRGSPRTVLYPGKVTHQTYRTVMDHTIQRYFKHPSYWKTDGKPYFSFYHLNALLESFGSVSATRAALDEFRQRTKAAGLPGLHLNAVAWGRPVDPRDGKPIPLGRLIEQLGFDSVTSYVWLHHVRLPEMQTDYEWARKAYFDYWDRAKRMFKVPYFPNVTVGWDSSPRADQSDEYGAFGYPFTNTIVNNTPERFAEALRAVRQKLDGQRDAPRIVTINSWNEWTEGSYLEPDTANGMKYLQAVRDVFPPAQAASVARRANAEERNPEPKHRTSEGRGGS